MFETGGNITSKPAIGPDGKVYVVSNRLFASLSFGSKEWEFTFGGAEHVTSPVVDSNGNVYFGADDTLYAVDLQGNEKWSKEFESSDIEMILVIDYFQSCFSLISTCTDISIVHI